MRISKQAIRAAARLNFRNLCPHVFEELLGDHVSDAVGSAAGARVITVVLQIEAVVESDFLAWGDIAGRHDPDMALLENRFAVRSAAMVDKPRRVPVDTAVNIMLIVQGEDILVVQFAAPERFLLVDDLANILDEARARGDLADSKRAGAMNA